MLPYTTPPPSLLQLRKVLLRQSLHSTIGQQVHDPSPKCHVEDDGDGDGDGDDDDDGYGDRHDDEMVAMVFARTHANTGAGTRP